MEGLSGGDQVASPIVVLVAAMSTPQRAHALADLETLATGLQSVHRHAVAALLTALAQHVADVDRDLIAGILAGLDPDHQPHKGDRQQ